MVMILSRNGEQVRGLRFGGCNNDLWVEGLAASKITKGTPTNELSLKPVYVQIMMI